MTKEDLVRALAEKHPTISKKNIATLVDSLLSSISESLRRGEEVQLGDFGTFSLAEKTLKSLTRRR